MSPFYNFQSYPNTYYTKLRGTLIKLSLWHQKMNCLVCNYPFAQAPPMEGILHYKLQYPYNLTRNLIWFQVMISFPSFTMVTFAT
jgi:hypothetical protein